MRDKGNKSSSGNPVYIPNVLLTYGPGQTAVASGWVKALSRYVQGEVIESAESLDNATERLCRIRDWNGRSEEKEVRVACRGPVQVGSYMKAYVTWLPRTRRPARGDPIRAHIVKWYCLDGAK
jgi:hypothetical protein